MNTLRSPWWVASVAFAALGAAALFPNLIVEPSPAEDQIIWQATWRDPGLSAVDMDERIGKPLARHLQTARNLRQIETRSRFGETEIRVVTRGRDLAARIRELELGVGAGVEHVSAPDEQTFDVRRARDRMSWSLIGWRADPVFWRWLKNDLVPGMRSLNGVGDVRLIGAPADELEIRVDHKRLSAAGLTMLDVVNTVRHRIKEERARQSEDHSALRLETVPGLASIVLVLPSGSSAPLSTFAEIRVRSANTSGARFPLMLIAKPSNGVPLTEMAGRVDSYLGWLRGNGQLPLDVQIERATPPRATWARGVVAGAVSSILALMVFGALLWRGRSGWRWVAAQACALLITFGVLSLVGATLNEFSLAAVVMGLSASAMVMMFNLMAVESSASRAQRFVAMGGILVVSVFPVLVSDAAGDLATIFVFPFLLVMLASMGTAAVFGAGSIGFRNHCREIADRLGTFTVSKRGAMANPWMWNAVLGVLIVVVTLVLVHAVRGNANAATDGVGEGATATTGGWSAEASGNAVPDWRIAADDDRVEFFGLARGDAERLLRLTKLGATVAQFDRDDHSVQVRIVSSHADTAPDNVIVGGELRDRPQVRFRDVARAEPADSPAEIHRRFPTTNRAPDGRSAEHGEVAGITGLAVIEIVVPWLMCAVIGLALVAFFEKERRGKRRGRIGLAVRLVASTWPAIGVCLILPASSEVGALAVAGFLVAIAVSVALSNFPHPESKSTHVGYLLLGMTAWVLAALPWALATASPVFMVLGVGISLGVILISATALSRIGGR